MQRCGGEGGDVGDVGRHGIAVHAGQCDVSSDRGKVGDGRDCGRWSQAHAQADSDGDYDDGQCGQDQAPFARGRAGQRRRSPRLLVAHVVPGIEGKDDVANAAAMHGHLRWGSVAEGVAVALVVSPFTRRKGERVFACAPQRPNARA